MRASGIGCRVERTLRVQVPNYHILSKIVTYITTILNPSTRLLDPLDPWGYRRYKVDQGLLIRV